MTEIPELVRKSQKDRHDNDWFEAAQVDERVQKRRYGTTQAAELAGISHSLLYAAEQDGRLPEPEYRNDTAKKVRAGYTINHINHMRKVFGTGPKKPDSASAAVIGILNLKGGSQKTTTCQLFAQYLAIRGYRVLLLDTDPQGSLSFFFGKRPDDNVHYENIIAPFFLEDDEALVEAGHPPGSSRSLHYAIQKTYWDNIDIIPSCLQNLNIDLMMPRVMDEAEVPFVDRIMKLRNGLLEVGSDYDFIIVDGTPSLNLSTLNVVSACDMCFVPTPAAMLDFASTLQFAGLVAETIETYNESGVCPNIPDIRFFITKYSKSSYAQFMGQIIRRVFSVERGDVLSNEAHASDEIGKANNSTYSIYEQNPSESDNRKRLKVTVEMFDKLFSEMHDAVWETCYADFDREPYVDKIEQIMANAEPAKAEIENYSKQSRGGSR
ncbi:AAA family ATPase [Pseudoalteromonas luteoviolacea]|nr:AAA family ATPase [Pseudoalteromonas luteoviolacea]